MQRTYGMTDSKDRNHSKKKRTLWEKEKKLVTSIFYQHTQSSERLVSAILL